MFSNIYSYNSKVKPGSSCLVLRREDVIPKTFLQNEFLASGFNKFGDTLL